MAATQKFFKEPSPETWKMTLSCYDKVLEAKAATKAKPAARKELTQLDNWYQKELPLSLKERKFITKEELEKLMKWKLARGKFRPTLQGLVASNKAEDVEKLSKTAFTKMPDLVAAINTLTLLRGVGPATASAILAAYDEDNAPFMADESVLGVPGIGVIKYDLSCYTKFAKAVLEKTKQLHNADCEYGWTAHKVELAIWTHAMGHLLDKSLIAHVDESIGEADQSLRRDRAKRRSNVKENASPSQAKKAKN